MYGVTNLNWGGGRRSRDSKQFLFKTSCSQTFTQSQVIQTSFPGAAEGPVLLPALGPGLGWALCREAGVQVLLEQEL